MQDWILSMMQQYGYPGIALLMALENIFPPIPSELILTFGGLLAAYAGVDLWLVIASATVGSLLGAILLYLIGRLLSPDRLKVLFAGRLGRLLHLQPSHIDQALEWFRRVGLPAVFFCRFLPMVRSLISIPAGSARISWLPFLCLTALGSFLWNTTLVWAGVAAAESLPILRKQLSFFSTAGKGGLLLAGAAAFLWWWFHRRQK
jgi:membrane protein DedA with SNARE-associated domain